MTKATHDGTDAEPLAASFEEAAALWRKGIKAHVVLDLHIPTGAPSARAAWYQRRHEERLARAVRRAQERGLDFDLPF